MHVHTTIDMEEASGLGVIVRRWRVEKEVAELGEQDTVDRNYGRVKPHNHRHRKVKTEVILREEVDVGIEEQM